MKKIAIFTGYYLPHLGGVERYTHNLVKQLKKMGYETIIITTKYNEDLKEIEETEYAKIYRLPVYKIFCNRYPILKKNKKYKEIITQLKKEDISTIILNTRFWLTSLIGAEFAQKQKIPCCAIEHGSVHVTVNNKILDFFGNIYEHGITNKLKRNVKDFYGVSKKCNEWLKHFNIKAKGVIYNSIDDREYEKYKNDKYFKENNNKIKIVYAGRLLKIKGVDLLINAYVNLLKNDAKIYKDTELIIAGEGELEGVIKEASKKYNIKYLGKLNHDEIMSLFNQTDIFINPSTSPEGLPTAILEAGLMKCSVIATPMGGTIEVIENNVNGLICKPTQDSIEQSIKQLVDNEKERNKYAEKLHIHIKEKFSWENTTKELIKNINFK